MILIADSGATKTQWRLVESKSNYVEFETVGLNPYHYNLNELQTVISNILNDTITKEIPNEIHFYGSGCAESKMAQRVSDSILQVIPKSQVSVYSDILGAARALFRSESGLVVILGTGSAAAYYDGANVTRLTPSLGYIIGDEGSGAYLGKELIIDWLYGNLPEELSKKLQEFCPLTLSEILTKLYKDKLPAQFLSSFTPFILQNLEHERISNLVQNAFCAFSKQHLIKYPQFPATPVGVVGSVGKLFESFFEKAIQEFGGTVKQAIRYPIDGLMRYHIE